MTILPRCTSLLAVGLAAMTPCLACFSGLVLIPTADTVGTNEYILDLQVDGTIPHPRADTYILNSEVGVTDRVEAGADYDFSADASPRLLFNAKYRVVESADGAQGVAAGLCNVGRHAKASPYLVATQSLGDARAHLGVMEIEGRTRWFVGADRAMTDRISLMADYTSGEENHASLGASYQWTDHLGILAGVQFPNDGGDALFTLHLSLAGPLLQ